MAKIDRGPWGAAIRFFLLLAGPLVLWLLAAAPAGAQQLPCGLHALIVKTVTGPKYMEALKHVGIIDAQRRMEAYVSAQGSYTILIINPQGFACIVAAGQNWEDVPYLPGRKS
jgi:hypothetical protein